MLDKNVQKADLFTCKTALLDSTAPDPTFLTTYWLICAIHFKASVWRSIPRARLLDIGINVVLFQFRELIIFYNFLQSTTEVSDGKRNITFHFKICSFSKTFCPTSEGAQSDDYDYRHWVFFIVFLRTITKSNQCNMAQGPTTSYTILKMWRPSSTYLWKHI